MVVDFYHNKQDKKYKNSIPSRECILLLLRKNKDSITEKSIEKKFSLNSIEEKKALRRRLRAMERDGEIIYTRHHCYTTPEKLKIIEGKVIGHRDGYGFLRSESLKDDFFLSVEQMKLCIHGDIILAYIIDSDKKRRSSAKVLKILRKNNALIV
ncbi:MAG: winged-helix domain-containing protein, partial [Buchnera aphidicola]|nr:winged-helix domain-containing protein [Buchnera aphidicola]